ncbi:MAG: hypothetical protein WD894_19820 [Pirellulales bacterium]
MPTALYCGRRPFEIERQEAGEDIVVAQVDWPAVGGGDGGVEAAVGERQL